MAGRRRLSLIPSSGPSTLAKLIPESSTVDLGLNRGIGEG